MWEMGHLPDGKVTPITGVQSLSFFSFGRVWEGFGNPLIRVSEVLRGQVLR